MAKLGKPVKRHIIQRLAVFDTPTEVAASVKELFGVDVDRRQVHNYSPDHNDDVGKEWVALFHATRRAFLDSQASIPVAQKSYRLRELGKMYQDVAKGGKPNRVLAAQLLEQAAKESGDAYTNKRIIVPADPIAELAKLFNMTPEQLAAVLGEQGEMAVQP